MPKYDFEMDLSETTSTGIIAKKIKRGMTVLEFGCSYGRMTRYMKEVMDCDVYIVEYDREAYENAIKYAKDGICGDILQYEWREKYKDIRFDVIIFADVLEHLSEPAKVLDSTRNLLKKDGRIFVSVPNVTHNDIVLKATMERFDYTDIGLLDETHLHFWGLNNLEDLAKSSNLYIEKIEATYQKTGFTEQFIDSELEASNLLLNILKERKCGEVYQFLINFSKEPVEEKNKYVFEKPYIYTHVYMDRGNGFNEKECIPVKAFFSMNGTYYVNSRIEDVSKIQRIRFDPVEFQECIIKYFSIRQGSRILSPQFLNSVVTDKGILLKSMDPMICVDVETDGEPLTIDAEILLPGEKFISFLEENLVDFKEIAEGLGSKCREYSEELKFKENEQKKIIENLEFEYNKQIKEIQNDLDETQHNINEINEELQKRTALLDSYRTLADSKDIFITKIEKNIHEKEERITELYDAVEHYRRFPTIKFIRFVGKILRQIKRKVKVLVQQR